MKKSKKRSLGKEKKKNTNKKKTQKGKGILSNKFPTGLENQELKYYKEYRDMINKKHLPHGFNKKKTIFISGHMDTSDKEFNKYYKPKIDEYCNGKYDFIMGGAEGLDNMAIDYLLKKHDSMKKKFMITVCFPQDELEEFSNKYKDDLHKLNMVSHFKNIKKGDKKLVRKFQIRDIFMTNNSILDVTFLRQYGGAASASAENVYRRMYGIKKADKLVQQLRKISMEYIPEKQKLTIEK